MGQLATLCRLGALNADSYLPDRLFQPPQLLQDARMKLSEITMDPPVSITPETTIYETMQIMQKENLAYCGVVDARNHVLGMVTKSDFSVVGLDDTARSIDILAHTPVENIRKTINGSIVYDDPNVAVNGKVSIIAMTYPATAMRSRNGSSSSAQIRWHRKMHSARCRNADHRTRILR